MAWLILTLIATISWGVTDVFSKMSVDENDKDFHIKLTIWTGMAMGVLFLMLLPFSESKASIIELSAKYIEFVPPALLYIISIMVGFVGLKYLELSVFSPIQNASGAVAMLIILAYYLYSGRISAVSEVVSPMDWVGVVLATAGILSMAAVQHNLSREKKASDPGNNKYRYGAVALLFPLAFCFMDAAGTVIDNFILNGTDGQEGIGAVDYLILYNLAFFVVAVILWIYLLIVRKKPYNPFQKSEIIKAASGIGELLGNAFYIFAMALDPLLTGPIISAYCVVSVVLSGTVLKERLRPSQYLCVGLVLAGIIVMAVSEIISIG